MSIMRGHSTSPHNIYACHRMHSTIKCVCIARAAPRYASILIRRGQGDWLVTVHLDSERPLLSGIKCARYKRQRVPLVLQPRHLKGDSTKCGVWLGFYHVL